MRLLPVSVLVLASSVAGQKFEVASIRPNADNDNRIMMRIQPGGRFTASGVTVRQLIAQAYDVRDFQITGGPGWIGSQRYDLNAKAEGEADRLRPDELRPMIQSLLEERFGLKVHKQTKEMPVYALVVGKNGPKLKPGTGGGQGPGIRIGRGQLTATNVPVSTLAQDLSRQLGRRVIDKTGLTGEYDIELHWTPEPGQGGGPFGGPPPPDALPPADSTGPTIFTAVQEQLGLRLESQRGPVEIVVIDSISQPTEN